MDASKRNLGSTVKPPELKTSDQYKSLRKHSFREKSLADHKPIPNPVLKQHNAMYKPKIKGSIVPSVFGHKEGRQSKQHTTPLTNEEIFNTYEVTTTSSVNSSNVTHVFKLGTKFDDEYCYILLVKNGVELYDASPSYKLKGKLNPRSYDISYHYSSMDNADHFCLTLKEDSSTRKHTMLLSRSNSRVFRAKASEMYRVKFNPIEQKAHETTKDHKSMGFLSYPDNREVTISFTKNGLYSMNPSLAFLWNKAKFSTTVRDGKKIVIAETPGYEPLKLYSLKSQDYKKLTSIIRDNAELEDLISKRNDEAIDPAAFYSKPSPNLTSTPVKEPLRYEKSDSAIQPMIGSPKEQESSLAAPAETSLKSTPKKSEEAIDSQPDHPSIDNTTDRTEKRVNLEGSPQKKRALSRDVVDFSEDTTGDNKKSSRRGENKEIQVEPTDEDYEILTSEGFQPFTYKFWDGKSTDVGVEDIARLNPSVYVNDTIIWFFLRYFLEELNKKDSEMASKIYLLDTFFYSSLRNGPPPPWINKIPLSTKDCLVMPINDTFHWVVAIIIGLNRAIGANESSDKSNTADDGYKPAIIILDSLGLPVRAFGRKIVTALNNALKAQNITPVNLKKFRILKGEVPNQSNSTDCGVYLIHFIEQFIKDPEPLFKSTDISNSSVLEIEPEYWKPSDAFMKREELKQVLKKLGGIYYTEKSEIENNNDESDDLEVVEVEKVTRRKRRQPLREHSITVEDIKEVSTSVQNENDTNIKTVMSSNEKKSDDQVKEIKASSPVVSEVISKSNNDDTDTQEDNDNSSLSNVKSQDSDVGMNNGYEEINAVTNNDVDSSPS